MEYLKEIIIEDAIVRSDKILDVKGFLNEQVNPTLMNKIGEDFALQFRNYDFDAFITVEASGIAPAIFASYHMDKPLIILKKEDAIKDGVEQKRCFSYTKNKEYYLSVSKKRITDQKFILIDDFLAEGNVVLNVKEMLENNGSELLAAGICISKDFQNGYKRLTDLGFDLYCQAQVKELDPINNKVLF